MKATLVAVAVMGDVARSPRMVNRARELVANGFEALLIGYRGREFEAPAGFACAVSMAEAVRRRAVPVSVSRSRPACG